MNNAVSVWKRCSACLSVAISLIILLPWAVSGQSISPQQAKPAAGKTFILPPHARSQLTAEDQEPDPIAARLSVIESRTISEPGLLKVDEAPSSSGVNIVSVTLWTGAFDVETFQHAGTPYAASVFAGGLRIYDLSAPDNPFNVSELYLEWGAWRITREGSLLYITDYYENGVYTVNISDPWAPVLLGYFSYSADRLENLDAEGNLLYLAGGSTGLVILDVSDPNSPVEQAVYTDIGGAKVKDVSADGGYVFIGLHTGEIQVVDATTPTAPVRHADFWWADQTYRQVTHLAGGGFHSSDIVIGVGHTTSLDSVVVDFYTWDPGSQTFNTLTWMILVMPGNTSLTDLVAFENQVYLATYEHGITAIDITDITGSGSPVQAGSPNNVFGIYGVTVEPSNRALVFMEFYGGLVTTRLLDDSPSLGDLGGLDAGGSVNKSDIEMGKLFVAHGYMGLTILDISDPFAPYVIQNSPTAGGWSRNLELFPPFIYMADGTTGVRILSYDRHADFLTEHGTYDTAGYSWDVALKTGGTGAMQYLYVADGLEGITILDVSDPDNITFVGNIPFSGSGSGGVLSIEILQPIEKLAAAQTTDGVDIWDISTPASPRFVTNIAAVNYAVGVDAYNEEHLIISDTSPDLSVYDLGSSTPVLLGSYSGSPGSYRSHSQMELNGFLALGTGGFSILNVDDPVNIYEETNLYTAGFTRHVLPGTEFLFASDTYHLLIGEIPFDLYLTVSPEGNRWVRVGEVVTYGASGGTGPYYYYTRPHIVDGRTVAVIDTLTGVLTGTNGGSTFVTAYDSAHKWGVSDRVLIWGGLTLISEEFSQRVRNIDDFDTSLFITPYTFNGPAEVEVRTLDISTQVPAPPGNYEHVQAYDLVGTDFETGNPLEPANFNNPVTFNVHYDEGLLPGSVDESTLTLLHYNMDATAWEPVFSIVDPDADMVIAPDLTGFSIYSLVYPMTALTAPALADPGDGEYLNDTDVILRWSSVSGATEYYFEVASDPGFGDDQVVWTEIVGGTGTTVSLAGLPQVQYFWRVQASDGFASSPFSGTQSFFLDLNPPNVGVAALPTVNAGQDVQVAAAVTDNFVVSSVQLFFRSAGNVDWTSAPMGNIGGDIYRVVIPGAAVGQNGFHYFVQASDAAGNVRTATEAGNVEPGSFGGVVVEFTELPSAPNIPRDHWLMVSVPHNPDNSRITEILSGVGEYDGTVWRFFQWIGTEYRERSGAQLQPGRAYWLHHRKSGVHFEVGTGSSVPSGTPFTINLQEGWNDIASPWLFNVPWDTVMTANGLTPAQLVGPYTYVNNDWNLPTSGSVAPAWWGVAVYNRSGAVIQLSIPPVNAASIPVRDRVEGEDFDGWRLQLMLSQDGATGSDDQNYVGVLNGASSGWDPNDYPDPPMSLAGTARLSVDHTARTHDPGCYATDYIDQVSEGYSWPLVVESVDGVKRASLRVNGIEKLPDGYMVAIVDVERNLRIDMDGTDPYRFYPSNLPDLPAGRLVRRSLRLLVGTGSYLEGMTAGTERIPARVELRPNYPNPFNPSTTIQFGLREATKVRLEIRNVRGQLVKVLAEGVYNAGQHTVTWDGRDGTGNRVASGIYLSYLKAGGVVRSRKMTLIR